MGNDLVAACMADLHTMEPDRQHSAFQSLMAAAKEPVDWAYDVWDDLLGPLKTGDNRQRAIAAQVLCALAKNDPKQRMLKDLATLLAVTKDERFVTARHCMQSLWKVGVAGDGQRSVLIKGLVARFKECAVEKNCTLIRYDILESLRKVYDAAKDEGIRETAAKLIEMEHDLKYKKKYLALWRN